MLKENNKSDYNFRKWGNGLDYINFILKYLGELVVTTGIIAMLFKSYFKNLVDQFFKKELAHYQYELNLITEEKKFDYQRKIQDFNLYTSKKHESYQELYRLVVTAKHKIIDLADETELENSSGLSLYDYVLDLEAVKNIKGKLNSLNQDSNDSKSKYSNIESEIRKQRSVVVEQKFLDMDNSINEYEDYFRRVEVFCSYEVTVFCEDILMLMRNLATGLKHNITIREAGPEFMQELSQLPEDFVSKYKSNLRKYGDDLKNAIKEELSVGDYSKFLA